MSSLDLLSTYLNGHMGGANAGIALARRMQQQASGDQAAELRKLADEIEADRGTLHELIDLLEVGHHRVKQAPGRLGAAVQRLGAHEKLTGSSELSWLLDCETLALGIEGKLALWMALGEVTGRYPALADLDLARLADRARDQRRRLENVRRKAAQDALGMRLMDAGD
jgi:hypothetical protein